LGSTQLLLLRLKLIFRTNIVTLRGDSPLIQTFNPSGKCVFVALLRKLLSFFLSSFWLELVKRNFFVWLEKSFLLFLAAKLSCLFSLSKKEKERNKNCFAFKCYFGRKRRDICFLSFYVNLNYKQKHNVCFSVWYLKWN